MEAAETMRRSRKMVLPSISWGAIFGGLASGMATYLLLALLGIAAGLSAVNPQAAEPVGRVPMFATIWTGISMIASAFLGGYVATLMSGRSRLSDGILHGLVAWGLSTLLFAYIITTSAGSVLGGAFRAVGEGLKAAGGAVTGAAGTAASSPEIRSKLEALVSGGGGLTAKKESLEKLQKQLQAGDRDGAVSTMVNEMGISHDRAAGMVDQGMSVVASARQATAQLPEKAKEVAGAAVSGARTATWVLFAALLLSMAVSLGGGAVGAKAAAKRRAPLVHA